MKYIRTKDGRIVAIPNNSKLVLYDDEKLIIDTTKKGQTCVYGFLDKQADTIEELFDEIVIFGLFDVPYLLPKWQLEHYKTLEQFGGNVKSNRKYEMYGAIWTNKGLIYVAKMNEKGELELL